MPDFLFDELPTQCKPHPGTQCGDCKHIQKWQCGGSFFFYCGIIKDRKTLNGLKKVKCKTPSCYWFEKEAKNVDSAKSV
jgi:hypothetical protein